MRDVWVWFGNTCRMSGVSVTFEWREYKTWKDVVSVRAIPHVQWRVVGNKLRLRHYLSQLPGRHNLSLLQKHFFINTSNDQRISEKWKMGCVTVKSEKLTNKLLHMKRSLWWSNKWLNIPGRTFKNVSLNVKVLMEWSSIGMVPFAEIVKIRFQWCKELLELSIACHHAFTTMCGFTTV